MPPVLVGRPWSFPSLRSGTLRSLRLSFAVTCPAGRARPPRVTSPWCFQSPPGGLGRRQARVERVGLRWTQPGPTGSTRWRGGCWQVIEKMTNSYKQSTTCQKQNIEANNIHHSMVTRSHQLTKPPFLLMVAPVSAAALLTMRNFQRFSGSSRTSARSLRSSVRSGRTDEASACWSAARP